MTHSNISHNTLEEIRDGLLPDYNTSNEPVELRGYGRNIKQMVDHCMEIEDRAERTACAMSIIKTMDRVRQMGYSQNTLWDHLYCISGYKLDIDYPNGYVPKKLSNLKDSCGKVEYRLNKPRYRHYGNNIVTAINEAIATEDENARQKLIGMIANQMKRCYVLFNKDTVTDNKIFDDLYELSGQKINIKDGELKLIDAQAVLDATNPQAKQQNKPQQSSKKKKKKK